jgi:hypothetical protein
MMLRWVFLAIVAMLVVSWLFSKRLPWLEKLGLTKLKSHWSFRLFGREHRVPVTYVVLLITIVYMAAYLAFALLYK